MKKYDLRGVKSVYGICLSTLTMVVGVLFIVQVWSIFLSAVPDEQIYTVEIVAKKFWQISIPVFLWVLAVIGGGVLAILSPDEKEKIKGGAPTKLTMEKLQRRIKDGGLYLPEVQKEEDFRFIAKCIVGTACLACSGMVVAILCGFGPVMPLGGEFFVSHAHATRLVSSLPWLVLPFALLICASYFFEFSYRRQTKTLKAELVKSRLEKPVEKKTFTDSLFEKLPFLKSAKFMLGLRIGFAIVGVLFVIVGILNGGMDDVLTKAINICTQCIGLG